MQTLALYRTVFSNSIKWPNAVQTLMSCMQFATLDLYLEAFKEIIDCRMHASFFQRFTFAISIFPVFTVAIATSYGIAITYRNLKDKATRNTSGKNLHTVKFTNNSLERRAHTLFIFSGFLTYSLASNLSFSM